MSVHRGLLSRLLDGDARALARAISAVENRTPGQREILRAIQDYVGRAMVVGVTGVPGAGKSTLVNAYLREIRAAGRTAGVIAIDPTSPFSGGAVLGDRIRMGEHASDPGVFVRSLASRGHGGGLAPTTAHVVDLMDAAGRDVVVVETVGTGQTEVDVADVADVRVLVCAPGLGDEIQTLKAGTLEIADLLVVNKSDTAASERLVNQLESMLALVPARAERIAVCRTVATTGEGVRELAAAIERCFARLDAGERRSLERFRRLLAGAAGARLARALRELDAAWLDELCDAVRSGDTDLESAARRVATPRDADGD